MEPKNFELIEPLDLGNQIYFQELTRRINVLYEAYLQEKTEEKLKVNANEESN